MTQGKSRKVWPKLGCKRPASAHIYSYELTGDEMLGGFELSASGVDDDVWGLLMQLKANTPASVLMQRSSDRIEMRVDVVMRPGNSSERHREILKGKTADISEGGCQVVLDRPVWVGDFFLIEFDRETLDVEPVTARCLRCRWLSETTFEAGFKFSGQILIH